MNFLRPGIEAWRGDHLLGRVVRNSSYLFISNAISAVLSIVTANLLGVINFGLLGIIISFVSNANRFLSFRMSELVVKYVGEAVIAGDKEKAAAVVKAAGGAEAITSIFAYLVVLALSPFAAKYIAHDVSFTPLFYLYGVSILTHFASETANGVLQVSGHYRSLALINLAQSVATALGIVYAYFINAGLVTILMAYLLGKIILGLAPIMVALYWLPRYLYRGWHKTTSSLKPYRNELIRFGISTNFSGTINMVARDSEVLWVGFFFSPMVAGLFKTALAIINLIVMPITPFVTTTFPEITKSIASRQWLRLKNLMRRVTILSSGWTIAVALGLILFGRQLLFSPITLFGRAFSIYSSEFLPAYPILLVLLIGFGFANILFWNRPLLLAFGQADYALWTAFLGMLAKVCLAFLLLPKAGPLAEAGLLSGYFIITIGTMVWKGLRQMVSEQAVEINTGS
ncbi:MAG: oligosaccharide flippase family protein [Anaerolineaceae bacterium]|nr:oligosaccharide flippase family protein [Anaerolineaceae bacterium]MBN2676973.1 oligosaccharide flippase family protein [Anaerolineaceae bacterium]